LKKKILFISLAKEIGGGEIVLRNLISDISKRYSEDQIKLLCNRRLMKYFKDGGNIDSLEISQNSFSNFLYYLVNAPSIIAFNEFSSVIKVPLFFRSKCIVILHTNKELGKKWFYNYKILLFKYLSKYIDKFVSVSRSVEESWESITNSIVITNGIRIPTEPILFKQNQTPSIGYVGNFSISKGQNDFLDLLIKYNIHNKVHFFGKGKQRLQLEKKAIEGKLNVIFHGFVNNQEKLYRSFDILVSMSTSEGYGLVYDEALSYQKLIISYDVGHIAQIVKNEYNGFLIQVGNKVQFSNKLLQILNDKKLFNKIQRNVRKSSGLIKSSEQMTNNYLNLFDNLLSK